MHPQWALFKFLLFREHLFSISSCMTEYLVCSTSLVWASGLGHSLCVLKHIISNLRLIYLKGKRLSERSLLMTKFFELGSNTFSPKWRCFGLSAYLVECKHLFQKFQPFWPKSNFYSNLFRSKTNEQPSCFILHHPCLQCLLRLFI